jgi:hypothetical protein
MRGPLDRSRLAAPAFALAATVVFATGCGSSGTYKNQPRPPSPIVITAAITPNSVTVSPKNFGAGPITLVVTNQTEKSQRLTLSRQINGQPQANGETGPINPHDTASLKADVDPGDYTVSVDGNSVKPAKLSVGKQRKSAQNDLLQP